MGGARADSRCVIHTKCHGVLDGRNNCYAKRLKQPHVAAKAGGDTSPF